MLEVASLHRSFGLRRVLRGVEFTAADGEVVALCGLNGSGKTTLLRICASLARPSRYPHLPAIRVDGFDLLTDGVEARSRLGYLGHHAGAYPELSAYENLLFAARLNHLDEAHERVMAGLRRVNLDQRADDPAGTFSHGMLQRLALARSLLHEPTTLLLDEPYQGLDTRAAQVLTDIIGENRDRGQAVVIATHNIPRGLELADRVMVLTNGSVNMLEPGPEGVTEGQVAEALGGQAG